LRVLLAGICRTDVQAADGLFPIAESRILGHEMAGEVAEADPGSELHRGDRVTVAPLLPCGTCVGCAKALRGADDVGVDVDGAFAEEVVIPSGYVHRVPRGLSLRRAAYVEPVAAALAVVRAPIRTQQRGLVLGTGRIADLTARVLSHLGFTLGQPESGDRASSFDYVVETSGTDASPAERARFCAVGGRSANPWL
jgi:threonine dehydrogenase-like Zn-dependent dehydrogenase